MKSNMFMSRVSLESDDIELGEPLVAPLDQTPHSGLDTSETPEATEIEARAAGCVVDEIVAEINETATVAAGLESIYLALKDIQVSCETLTPAAATMLHEAVDCVVAPTGAEAEDVGIPPIEDFVEDNEAAVAASMEGIGEQTKNAAKKMVEMLKQLMEKLAEFFTRLLDSSIRGMNKTQKMLKDLKDAELKTEPVSLPDMFEGGYPEPKRINLTKDTIVAVSQFTTERIASVSLTNDPAEEARLMHHLQQKYKIILNPNSSYNYLYYGVVDNFLKLQQQKPKDSDKVEVTPTSLNQVKQVLEANLQLLGEINKYRQLAKKRKDELKTMTVMAQRYAASGSTTTEGPKAVEIERKLNAYVLVGALCAEEKKFVSRSLAVAHAVNNVVASSVKFKHVEKEEGQASNSSSSNQSRGSYPALKASTA